MKHQRITRRTIFLSTGFATLVIIVYMILMVRNLEVPVHPEFIAIAWLTCILGWLVSAYRLRYLHRKLGSETILPIHEYFKARILGGFLAYITPSGIGGEPARAYYLSLKGSGSFSRYFSIAIVEPIYDILVVNTIAIGFIVYAWPFSILVLIIALGNVLFWLVFYYVMRNLINPELIKYPLNKIVNFVVNYFKKHERLYSGYGEFAASFRELSENMGTVEKAVTVILTLLYQTLLGLVGFFVYLSYGGSPSLKIIMDSIIGYLFSNSLSSIPTPGGSISAEYGLSLVLPPNVVLLTRIVLYYTPLVIGFYYIHRERIIEKIVFSE